MPTNRYFRPQYHARSEQKMLEDLAVEAIQLFGQDVLYVPRNLNNYDVVYGEDDQSSYTWAIPIEMYLKTYDGFQGDGNFMSKFGLEIRDQAVWSVARRRFLAEVGDSALLVRPREGDLIYYPMNDKCYQIKYVSKLEHFYELGKLQTWDMTCELMEFSDEVVATGVPEIDRLQKQFSTNVLDWAILTEDGFPLRDENGDYILLESYGANTLLAEDEELVREADQFIAFDVTNPFAETPGSETGSS